MEFTVLCDMGFDTRLSLFFFVKPIQLIVIKLYPKKNKKRFKQYQNYIIQNHKQEQNPTSSNSVRFAFEFMLFTSGFAFCLLIYGIFHLIDPQLNKIFYLIFFGGFILSICVNYFFLYSNDKYLKHFKSFKQSMRKSQAYWIAILFHLITYIFLFFGIKNL